MNIVIYGANLTGYIITKLLEFKNDEILCYIDRNPENMYEKIDEKALVFHNIESVPSDIISSIDEIIIALGNEEQALSVANELGKSVKCKVTTAHQEPYKYLYKKLIDMDNITYLEEKGFYRSKEVMQSVDKFGNPIPWFSYALFDFIKDRISKDFRVFEYGSGNSTIWWSKNVKEIFAVEHNKEWYEYVEQNLNIKSAKLIYRELIYGGDYSKSINDFQDIDIAIIDGRDRVNCAMQSVKSLKPTGVIVWDDVERMYYEEGMNYLKKEGFKEIRFSSIKALSGLPSYTSIFYRTNNCLGI